MLQNVIVDISFSLILVPQNLIYQLRNFDRFWNTPKIEISKFNIITFNCAIWALI